MQWLFLAVITVMGFMLLKVRRRRKAREAESGSTYSSSRAA